MSRVNSSAWIGVLACVLGMFLASESEAGTIIKLGLGGDATADLEFDGTTLSTIDDLVPGTTGDQNTNAEFLDFLSAVPDVDSPPGSFTLSGLTPSGPANVQGGTVVLQNFSGGTLSLWDDSNVLLLSGTLADSLLVGPIGPPATGALFTTTFGAVTGGTLAPQIIANSLSLSMSFTDVNSGAGFSVSGAAAPLLNPFVADVTLNIAANEIPEPTSLVLVIFGSAVLASISRRRRRS